MEDTPTSVTATSKQVGYDPRRWCWTEPAVWTDRMLTALEQGVKGGRWFSLMDKVYHLANLQAATMKVVLNQGAAGVDHVTTKQFSEESDTRVAKLAEQLRDDTYRPHPVRRTYIDKLGSKEKRPLGIPSVRDRVVQTAVRNVMEPIFEHDFAEHSYGFRPGKGAKDALRRVDRLLNEGYVYVVDADLKSYFDTIPHDKLMQQVRRKISDGRLLKLLEAFLSTDILEECVTWTPIAGAPQGAVLTPPTKVQNF